MTKNECSRRDFIKQSSLLGLKMFAGWTWVSGRSLNNITDAEKKQIVFLISQDVNNYKAHRTIPVFANMLEQKFGYQTTVLLGEGERSSFYFPELEALKEADLLTVFCRRVALPIKQMKQIKRYLRKGKPLLGIRTANHAFSVQEDVKDGYTDWWGFVPHILGCKNRGYGPADLGTVVEIARDHENHPILKRMHGLDGWHSSGSLYLVAPLLDDQAHVLLKGKADGKVEPIAWVRTTHNGSQVFYTSMGYPTDFKNNDFLYLLRNAIYFLTM